MDPMESTLENKIVVIAVRLIEENEDPYNWDSPQGEWCIICKADKPTHESDCDWTLLDEAVKEYKRVK